MQRGGSSGQRHLLRDRPGQWGGRIGARHRTRAFRLLGDREAQVLEVLVEDAVRRDRLRHAHLDLAHGRKHHQHNLVGHLVHIKA